MRLSESIGMAVNEMHPIVYGWGGGSLADVCVEHMNR
jgi:hypothetical protein